MKAAVAGACVCWLLAAAHAACAAQRLVVHPAGATVPENLLRIELRFTEPLARAMDISGLQLLDDSGQPIDNAFLDLLLPSADGRRVTVLLDPGRLKSGVRSQRALGRALKSGTGVRLVVHHPSMGQPTVKPWRVTPIDADPLRPETWRFASPRAHRRDSLVVRLDKPISSVAEDLIAVRGPDGERVAGRAVLERGDAQWRFTPASPWRPGSHAIVVHPSLEDPAGNRACAAFEAIRLSQADCRKGLALPFETVDRR